MISFGGLSIPKKIVAIIMIISGATLLLATGALIVYEFTAARQELKASATVLARVVAGNNTAAVSFDDPAAAVDTLNSLRAESSIIAACIYTPRGLFAQYAVTGAPSCSARPAVDADDSGSVLVSAPIELNEKHIGSVQIRATLAPVYAQLRMQLATIGAILITAALFAFALSSRLHKFVSEPILNLADTAREVSQQKDYSIRAVKQNEDELGVLVDAFNEMLGQIQQRESVLQQRTAELVQAGRMKDEFLATLSHELRTPLNSILGWSVLMQQGQLTPDHERAALAAIERNARVQSRLIEDLLDVSRIISGKFTLDSARVELRQIVENAIKVVGPAAEAKQIHIEFEKPSAEVLVSGDALRLQQVVWNLLSNGIKFTGKHGRVIIHLNKTERHARISVSDNGTGIPREFLPHVFDRFRQADGSSTRRHGGLGLGLAIVGHVVAMHGGSVRVESEGQGHGTTFTIELPLLLSEEQAGERLRRIV
jgi:signal transduction histidine kinase